MAIHQGVCRETAILLGDSWLKTHICRRNPMGKPQIERPTRHLFLAQLVCVTVDCWLLGGPRRA